MASRSDHHKRERSWERHDRERDREKGRDRYHRDGRRSSRSRSPRRSGRREYDRRDYKRERDDDRRERSEHRRRDDGRQREYKQRDRDEGKSGARREDESRHDERPPRKAPEPPQNGLAKFFEQPLTAAVPSSQYESMTNDKVITEDGEEIDAMNDDDASTMAVMGMSGFGSTKGKHVVGNQDGGVNIKKMRTWRQYMNRRGGFNRPLDKIK